MSDLVHYGSKGQAECGTVILPDNCDRLTLTPGLVTCRKCKGWLPIVAPELQRPKVAVPKTYDRRHKLVFIGKDTLIELLGDWQHHEFIRLPVLSKLPADCRVLDAHFDICRDCFVVRVWSSAFESVAEGLPTPYFEDGLSELVTVKMTVRRRAGLLEVVPDKPTIAGE